MKVRSKVEIYLNPRYVFLSQSYLSQNKGQKGTKSVGIWEAGKRMCIYIVRLIFYIFYLFLLINSCIDSLFSSHFKNVCMKVCTDRNNDRLTPIRFMKILKVSTTPEETSIPLRFHYFLLMGRKPSEWIRAWGSFLQAAAAFSYLSSLWNSQIQIRMLSICFLCLWERFGI